LGLKFEAHRPQVDEEKLKEEGPKDLLELTRVLAGKKAASLRAKFPNDLILGSDQLVDFKGHRLDKPGTAEKAEQQLHEMSGHKHRLITSLSIQTPLRILTFTDVTTVHFKKLSPELIKYYVQLDNPIDCAGSYKIEKAGMLLIEKIETEDHSAIQGLPILSLLRGLEQADLKIENFLEK
jgi:septum formation protein